MTEDEILSRVRVVLDKEHQRVCDELGAAVLADVPALLVEVEDAIARAVQVEALRARKGRHMSRETRDRLTKLHQALDDLAGLVRTGALA